MNDEHLLSELREDPPQALADAFYLKMKEKEKMELALQAQKSNIVSVRWLRVVVAAAVIIVAVYFLFAQLENRPNSVQEQPILQTSATQTDPTPLPTQPSITIPVGAIVDDLDATTIQHMKNAGITWVHWYIYLPHTPTNEHLSYASSRIAQTQAAGFKVSLIIYGSYFILENYEETSENYLNFVSEVAMLRPDAIQIGYSVNGPGEINDSEKYVGLIRQAHDVIKAIDSNIKVISAPVYYGMGEIYYQEMADAGVEDYADCIGVHYSGVDTPPDAISIDPNSNGSYFIPTLDEAASAFASSNVPLCITSLILISNSENSQQIETQYLIQALQLVSSVYTTKPVELVIVSFRQEDNRIAEDGTCLFCDLLAAEVNP